MKPASGNICTCSGQLASLLHVPFKDYPAGFLLMLQVWSINNFAWSHHSSELGTEVQYKVLQVSQLAWHFNAISILWQCLGWPVPVQHVLHLLASLVHLVCIYIYFSLSGYYVKHVIMVRIQLSSLRTKWLEMAMARNIHFLGLFWPVQGWHQKTVVLLGLCIVLKSFSTYIIMWLNSNHLME